MDNILRLPSLIIITGGARGLGQAIALQFSASIQKNGHASGSRMVLLDLLDMTETRQKIQALSDIEVQCVQHDLSQLNTYTSMFNKLEAAAGITETQYEQAVLVNNAGTCVFEFVQNLMPTDIEKFVTLNLSSMIALTSWFVRTMKPCGSDIITINMTSQCTKRSLEGSTLYAACKMGREKFIKDLIVEDASVKCINYDPGLVETKLAEVIYSCSKFESMRIRMEKCRDAGLVIQPEESISQLINALQAGGIENGTTVEYEYKNVKRLLPPVNN